VADDVEAADGRQRTIRFDVLTLFPDLFQGYLSQSLLKLAIQRGLVQVHLWNIRDWATDKHQKVDDRPFGGGPGMVLMPEPVMDCVEAVRAKAEPAGRLLLLCGRYEGFDDRIRQLLDPVEVSVGDFVCNGGEVPAMVVIDTVIRLVPGVLGDEASAADESHSAPGRIEYPQYTRPRVFRGLEVPEVLLSGNHGAVARWREEQSRLRSERNTNG